MLASDKKQLRSKYKFLKGSIIVIEGNIASGKSTLTERLTAFLNDIGLETKLYKEPILQTYLDTFLKDQPKYAFGFQMSMLIENQCLYSDATSFTEKGGIAVLDRSFMGNKVFAKVQNEVGNISNAEMAIYDDVFRRLQYQPPDYLIYLTVDPAINVDRCRRRDRTCESSVYDIDYFSRLNRNYNQIISDLAVNNNVLVFDWNADIPDAQYSRVLMAVLDDLRTNYLAL